MKKVFKVVVKTLGLALVVSIFVIATREIFEIGDAEYLASRGMYKFLWNYTACLFSVLCGWIYVWLFKVLGMVKNIEL